MSDAREWIARVAKMAGLELSLDEQTALAPQLNSVIKYANALSDQNVSANERTPSKPLSGDQESLREDVAHPWPAKPLLEQCSDHRDGLIVVPIVIHKDGK